MKKNEKSLSLYWSSIIYSIFTMVFVVCSIVKMNITWLNLSAFVFVACIISLALCMYYEMYEGNDNILIILISFILVLPTAFILSILATICRVILWLIRLGEDKDEGGDYYD
jgi:hypothetical protein|nr:MAG TPA: hypothetical protein [Caudoviricetes sp.]